MHAHIGMLVLEPGDHAGDDALHEEGRAADARQTARAAAKSLRRFRRPARGGEHRLAVFGECPSKRCRDQWPLALDEQFRVQPAFQRRERLGDGGLRDAEQGGRLVDAAGLDHGSQMDELAFFQLHNQRLYWIVKK